jgi:hypothetical protein
VCFKSRIKSAIARSQSSSVAARKIEEGCTVAMRPTEDARNSLRREAF